MACLTRHTRRPGRRLAPGGTTVTVAPMRLMHGRWNKWLRVFAVAVVGATGCAGSRAGGRAPVLHVYLARHGQTDWNAARRLQGWSDTVLNDTGRTQAHELAARLHGVPLDRVYCSTLRRARETAEIAHGTTPIDSLVGLREQRVGRFEGASLADSLVAKEFDRRSHDPDDALDGGESDNQFFARVRDTFTQIVAQHRSGSILIVGHGGTNRMILRAALGLTREQAETVHQANDEVYMLEIAPAGPPRLWKAIGVKNLGDL
jgi:probable phosphoglycerate mutase